jgi:hypothetical protein
VERKDDRRRRYRWGAAGLALVALVAFSIEDWGRDFVSHEATMAPDAADPLLRPLDSPRPADQLVAGVKQAARRIGNWRFAGEASDGTTTLVSFERTNRLLRCTDDIVIRVEDRGDRRTVSGDSRARLAIGDLGRNPRNLKRLMTELRIVLEGSTPARLIGPLS